MKSDEEIKQDWMRLENDNIQMACEYLRKHENDIENYIADAVAALCNVEVQDMLSATSVTYIAQPRWLYWYAIRYMTNETYDKIAARTMAKSGYSFTPNGIGQSINKMARLINREPIWLKRWTIIKHIIKLRDMNTQEKDTIALHIRAPKGMKVELKTE